ANGHVGQRGYRGVPWRFAGARRRIISTEERERTTQLQRSSGREWHHHEQTDRHNGMSMGLRPPYRTVLRFRQRRHPESAREKVAVVLSGGGNRGAAQVGMLRALVETGVRPDVIVGTSVGSLNGAALAHDPTPAGIDNLEGVWLGTSRERLFADGRLTRAWRLASRASHLWGNEGLAALIDSFGVEE